MPVPKGLITVIFKLRLPNITCQSHMSESHDTSSLEKNRVSKSLLRPCFFSIISFSPKPMKTSALDLNLVIENQTVQGTSKQQGEAEPSQHYGCSVTLCPA